MGLLSAYRYIIQILSHAWQLDLMHQNAISYCAIPGCLNGSGDEACKPGIKWFVFPKDKERAGLWWHKIKRDCRLSEVKDPRVCSKHFAKEDFQRDLKYELMHPDTPMPLLKLKLSESAFPSIQIPACLHSRFFHVP